VLQVVNKLQSRWVYNDMDSISSVALFKNSTHQNKAESIMAKIMVVEDDEQASTFIAEVLALDGHEAIVVNDSSKALSIAGSTVPEAFLLDLMMPAPDGFKLCRMLRAEPKFKHTPIMIVTALDDTDSKIVAIGAGANDYLVKPFPVEDLLAKVKELLEE
jgi:Response regulators consisting of a CheY-like receiver domain and a winged-helix DNA-binding domain